VHGTRADAEALREEIADVLAPLELRLSEAKTKIAHMSERSTSLDSASSETQARHEQVVGLHLHRRPAHPVAEGQDPCPDPQDIAAATQAALTRLNRIMRGGASYFKHAVCKHTFGSLDNFVWHRVVRWWKRLHRWKWKDVRRNLTGPTAGGAGHRQTGSSYSTSPRSRSPRYLYRGSKIPSPRGPG
jgi:RNA-directed DNA polymerase